MAVELITGMAGKAHINSADDAKFNAAVCGPGNYLMTGMGDKELAASMATANALKVESGNIVAQGRHIIVDGSGLSWTVQNGTQGQKRNDLAVLRYTRNASTGVEAIAPVTIKGTPTTGTPADPAYTKGDALNGTATTFDIPIYRVPLNGITPGTPQLLLEKFVPAKEAWDSVARASGVITPVFNLEPSWQLTRQGGWAYLDLRAYTLQSARETWSTPIARLPEGFRPAKNIRSQCMIEAQYWEQVAPGYVTIFPNGDVELDYRVNFAPYTCDVSAVFPLA